jgi:micrococcal nuclease
MKPSYTYNCKALSVYDGDTFTAQIDCGFYITVTMPVRLAGINTPELKGETIEAGRAARDYLKGLIEDKPIVIKTEKLEKYGRILGFIQVDGVDINAEMIKAGHAKPFMVDV